MGYETVLDDLRVGTLHSLCDRTMREFRYMPYADKRLLDETEQSFFVQSEFLKVFDDTADNSFWEFFRFLHPSASLQYGPNQWQKVGTLVTLFNRVTDEDIDLARLGRSTRGTLKGTSTRPQRI